MPRFDNSSTPAGVSGGNNRNGQLKFHWSFSYEFDLPHGRQAAASQGGFARSSASTDELGALLDKALAFAG